MPLLSESDLLINQHPKNGRKNRHQLIKAVVISNLNTKIMETRVLNENGQEKIAGATVPLTIPSVGRVLESKDKPTGNLKSIPAPHRVVLRETLGGALSGGALTDTPRTTPGTSAPSTAPGSPRM
jgi:hypothetical protein